METVTADGHLAETRVRRAAAGDEAAFADLVAEHHRSMMRVAIVITGDNDVAADAVQLAWATAWRRLHTVRDARQVRPWLIAVAANEARQQIRKQRRRAVVELSVAHDDPQSHDPAQAISLLDLERTLKG